MSEKVIQARIQSKYASMDEWAQVQDTFVPKSGEICFMEVPAQGTSIILFKIGNGTDVFAKLPWVSANASDVYEWAKQENKPEYQANEIKGLTDFVKENAPVFEDTDTQYTIVKVNDYQYKLQSKGKDDVAFTDTDVVINIPDPTKTITELKESIGRKQDIVIWQSDNYDPSTNKAITHSDLVEAMSGLAGAMHFRGAVGSVPPSGDYQSGDVVISGNKEYVYDGENTWYELGDEAIYAVKGDIVNADIANNAAISQSKIAGLDVRLAEIDSDIELAQNDADAAIAAAEKVAKEITEITPKKIGAVAITGDTMTGNLYVGKAAPRVGVTGTDVNKSIDLRITTEGSGGLYDATESSWILRKTPEGIIQFFGVADTASKLASAKDISLTGDVTGKASFDGSTNASISATLATVCSTNGSYGPTVGTTLGFGGTVNVPFVEVDTKGRVTKVAHYAIKLPAAPTSVSGNAGTATALANPRKINGVAFDGSQDITISDDTKLSKTSDDTTSGNLYSQKPAPRIGLERTDGGKIVRRVDMRITTGDNFALVDTEPEVTNGGTVSENGYIITKALGGTPRFYGNADSLTTARRISVSLSTAATSGTSFDGTAAVTIGVTGTLPVANGGTGATTFTSGAALIGAGAGAVTTRAITNNTSASVITASTNLITANTLAYWNGAYSGTTSRLAYCNKGAFGSIVTKNAEDYFLSTSTIPINRGGTGATSKEAALKNLGAMGFIESLSSGKNIDDYTDTGIYFYSSSNAPTNAPTTSPSIFEVVQGPGGRIIQRLTRVTANARYSRYNSGSSGTGTWSDWYPEVPTYATKLPTTGLKGQICLIPA